MNLYEDIWMLWKSFLLKRNLSDIETEIELQQRFPEEDVPIYDQTTIGAGEQLELRVCCPTNRPKSYALIVPTPDNFQVEQDLYGTTKKEREIVHTLSIATEKQTIHVKTIKEMKFSTLGNDVFRLYLEAPITNRLYIRIEITAK